MEWFESLVLGLVQGLTEFLPVSSDGHLVDHSAGIRPFDREEPHGGREPLLRRDAASRDARGDRDLLPRRGLDRRPWPARLERGSALTYRRTAVIRTGLLTGVATLPLIPYAFLKDFLEKAFESTTAAGVGFLITAAVLAVTIRLPGGEKGPAETTWSDALLIGIAQMFAPLPGVSRSGLTVATALALGLSRTWAVGFSLLMAVPAILGAVVLQLRKVDPALLDRRPSGPHRSGDRTCRGRRLRGDHLARQDRAIGTIMVFFCVPGDPGGRRAERQPRLS